VRERAALQPAPAANRRVHVITGVVTAVHTVATPPRVRQRARFWLTGAAAIGAMSLLVGFVWLVVLAVTSLIAAVTTAAAWAAAHWVWIALAAAGLLFLLIRAGGTSCAGLHCGGCRR